ncbi:hypothetical protein D347_00943 [Enterococcus faecalis LA3B-2]|nr:hypothetical protein D347_00943 [Enterococcus faecalis LA3B-2]
MFLAGESLWNQGVLTYTNLYSQSVGEIPLELGEVVLRWIMLTRALNNRKEAERVIIILWFSIRRMPLV